MENIRLGFDALLEADPLYLDECIINEQVIYDLYCEAKDSKIKEGFFTKVWNFIKKIFRMIRDAVKRFLAWLKGLFSRKRKSANQIAEEVNLPKKEPPAEYKNVDTPSIGSSKSNNTGADKSSRPSRINPPPTPAPAPAPKTYEPGKRSVYSYQITSPEINPDMQAIWNPCIIKFNEDGSFTITLREAWEDENEDIGGPEKFSELISCFYLIKNPDKLQGWIDAFADVIENKVEFGKIYDTYDDMDKFRKKGMSLLTSYSSTTMTYQEIQRFQIAIDKMNKYIAIWDSEKTKINFEDNTDRKLCNDLAWLGQLLQVGLNGIMRAMKNVYLIDKAYEGVVGDPKQLADFVKVGIMSGMPGIYVIANTYIICNDTIKGNIGDIKNPTSGQTRVVLFPKDKENLVYKVAFNSTGIRANKNEITIASKIKTSKELSELLAIAYETWDNIIITMDRVEPIKQVDWNFCSEVKTKIGNIMSKLGFNLQIDDINPGGFGWKDGEKVLLDYGLLVR